MLAIKPGFLNSFCLFLRSYFMKYSKQMILDYLNRIRKTDVIQYSFHQSKLKDNDRSFLSDSSNARLNSDDTVEKNAVKAKVKEGVTSAVSFMPQPHGPSKNVIQPAG